MAGPSATTQRVRTALAPAVEAAGYDLEDVEVRPAGRRRLVRVVVDRDGGIGLDQVAEVSRVVSELLDSSDVMGESPYVLEVTSPGVDRPLTQARHWRRSVSRLVTTTLTDGGELTGRVLAADDETVTLLVGDEPGAERVLPLAQTGPGRVQVEFSRRGGGDGQDGTDGGDDTDGTGDDDDDGDDDDHDDDDGDDGDDGEVDDGVQADGPVQAGDELDDERDEG